MLCCHMHEVWNTAATDAVWITIGVPTSTLAAAHSEQLLMPARYGGQQVDSPVRQCIIAHITALVERAPSLRNALHRWCPSTDAADYGGIYRTCAASISHRLAELGITSIVAWGPA